MKRANILIDGTSYGLFRIREGQILNMFDNTGLSIQTCRTIKINFSDRGYQKFKTIDGRTVEIGIIQNQ